jgi:hypothetical protein
MIDSIPILVVLLVIGNLIQGFHQIRLWKKLEEKPIIVGRTSEPKRKQKKNEKNQNGKPRGKPKGANGGGRKNPDNYDHSLIIHYPELCPTCGRKLTSHDSYNRSLINLEFINRGIGLVYVKYIIKRGKCKSCNSVFSSNIPDFLPNARIGNNLMAWIAYKRIILGNPMNKIREEMEQFFGDKVSDPTVFKTIDRLAKKFSGKYQDIADKIRESKVVKCDETGVPINGDNWWAWEFLTKTLVVFELAQRRNHKVPKNFLGENFLGTLICDFYSSYNRLTYKQQKCIVHLLRIFERGLEKNPKDEELRRFIREVLGALMPAIEKSKEENKALPDVKQATEQELEKIFSKTYDSKFVQRMAKRLKKRLPNLLRFLDDPDIPPHNNDGERAFRPFAVFRKIIGCFRSAKGARNHLKMYSMYMTCKLQKVNFIDFLTGKDDISLK